MANRPEQELQFAIVDLLTIYERLGKLTFYAIPNGGKRPPIEASIFKRMGVRAGVPDLCILFPNGKCAYWELKAPNGHLSALQREWIGKLNEFGISSGVVTSLDDAMAGLRRMGVMRDAA